jgi:hypothetical protein
MTAKVYAHLLDDAQLDHAAEVFADLTGAQTLRETLREDELTRKSRSSKGISPKAPHD